MKNLKRAMKKITASVFAGALFVCTLTACESQSGENEFAVTKAQAESIALVHSGVSENIVTSQSVTAERKDGGNYYCVEFVCGNVKYAYRINGDTGDIVKLSLNGQNVDKDELPAFPADSESKYIGVTRAKEIALAHAEAEETAVTELETDFDFDDGTYLYEIEFTYGASEYEYELIASTGEIYALEINDFSVIIPTPSDTSITYISAERAKEIALEDSKIAAEAAKNASFAKAKFDKDNGAHVFKIEFTANGAEYEYEINAVSGAIIEKEINGEKQLPESDAERIGAAEAIRIASAHSGIAESAMLKKEAELKIKKGVYVYEVEFETSEYEYEYLVNAATGSVISVEKERND